MKKSFQKSLIAASVGAVMFAAAGTASANSLLFPFFTTIPGATSILSITGGTTISAARENLHYVYNYGTACTHFDGNGGITANDLLQHSILSPAPTAGGFGKVVPADRSTPFYFPLQSSGFMVVSNTTTAGKIAGDMAVADTNSGLIASFSPIDNGLDTSNPANEGNFAATITDTRFNLSFYPQNLVTTSWFGVVGGNMAVAISSGADWTGGLTLTNNNQVYDNDENALSGVKTKDIRCSGALAATDLMNTAQAAAVGPNGGLIHSTAGAFTNGATGLLLTKFQVLPGRIVLMHREQALGASF